MDANQLPSPDEARASLEQVAESRRAAAEAMRRPLWIDVGMAITVGASMALGPAGHPVIAIIVLAIGSLVFVVAERRRARGRGEVLDQRALGARAWRFAVVYALLFLLLQFAPPADWKPWYFIGVGVIAAAGGFAWLRWEDRYRARRLAAGDYGRYDLL